MNEKLSEIIKNSSFGVADGVYVYARVATAPKSADHFMVTLDNDEITVVTTEDKLGSLDLIERNTENWRLIALHVSAPFNSAGFLAAISQAIADHNIVVLIISTYSKDYLLVRQEDLEETKKALTALGLQN